MGMKFNERFENHMDGLDAGTKCDAKKIDDAEDAYNDGFEEKLSDAAESEVSEKPFDEDKEACDKKHEQVGEDSPKRTLVNGHIVNTHGYTMNTPKTIEHMREQMDSEGKDYFDKQLEAGGGVEGQRAHLRGVGQEYFMTSSTEQQASGNFLTEESPGDTPEDRKENLQLPPENDATIVDKVVSEKPMIVLTSDVSPQEQWAEKSGYEARDGMKQVFTPNLNKNGAIDAGIYKVESSQDDSDGKNEQEK